MNIDKPIMWTQATIGSLCGLINGRAFKPKEWSEAGLPIIRIQNLNNPAAKYNHFDGELADKHRIENGDLLFAWSGTPGTSFGAHVWSGETAALNQHIFKIEFIEALINKRFLRYAINQTLDELISGAHGGVGLRHVTKGKFEATKITLPPLAEQKVIADKLDTLLAQVETTKARLERIPQILKRFRQSVLAAAVSGRLTEEWRGTHEYESLDLRLEKSDEGILYSADWQTANLAETCKVISGNAFKSNQFSDTGTTPAIKISNVQYGSFEKKNQQYLPEAYLSAYQRFEVLPGDLLMALTRPITNDTLKVCRYPVLEPAGLLNQRVAKFLFHNEWQKEFFELLFQSNYFKLQVYDKLSETLQPNLSPVDLKKFIIALPSGEEQTQIVHRVNQLFAHADRIEQQVQAALERVNNLTQSILAKAFRGEMTEQWRKDNPELISGENSAAALLERIKAERKVMKPSKKIRAKAKS